MTHAHYEMRMADFIVENENCCRAIELNYLGLYRSSVGLNYDRLYSQERRFLYPNSMKVLTQNHKASNDLNARRGGSRCSREREKLRGLPV